MNLIDVLIFSAFLVLNLVSGIRGEVTTAQFGRFGKIFFISHQNHSRSKRRISNLRIVSGAYYPF